MITVLVAIALLVLLVPALVAGHSFAPWLPSRDDDVEAALELAAAQPGEIFYDLGCGDGRTLAVAARHGLKAVGVEMVPALVLVARVRKILTGISKEAGKIEIRLGNLFKADIADADIIFVYGLPHALRGPLAEKLEREAKPGVRVVSCHMHIRAWQEKAIGYSKGRKMPLYLYEVPHS